MSLSSYFDFCSIVGSLGASAVNGSAPNPSAINLPINGQGAVAAPVLPVAASVPVGSPSECLLLKNMFDPATEVCGFIFLSSFSVLIGKRK